jgi:2-amino-4-hydroxy-6-hydroxymethyldihydropteridine diphosphokinase
MDAMVDLRAYVGLGANLGDREGTLAAAIAALEEVHGVRVAGVSRLYATRPVGPPGQPDYRNAVVALDVRSPGAAAEVATALLRTLKRLEERFGRKPRERWAPRELDLDLLVLGRHRLAITDPDLTIPHPRIEERLFVLAPLRDLAPRLRPPGWPETVARAYRRRLAIEGADAVRPIGLWDPRARRWEPRSPSCR